jgi:hypothetical protein
MSSVAVYEVSLVQEETVFCIYNILIFMQPGRLRPSVGVQNMYRKFICTKYFVQTMCNINIFDLETICCLSSVDLLSSNIVKFRQLSGVTG